MTNVDQIVKCSNSCAKMATKSPTKENIAETKKREKKKTTKKNVGSEAKQRIGTPQRPRPPQ